MAIAVASPNGLWISETRLSPEEAEACKAVDGCWQTTAMGEGLGKVSALALITKLHCDRIQLQQQKDLAYSERDKMLALFCRLAIASGITAGLGKHIGGEWDDDWRNIVFIDLPSGQISFHIHDSELPLFDSLPEYAGEWDGHDTETKWERAAIAEFEKPKSSGRRK